VEIPVHKKSRTPKVAIDYNAFIHILEKEKGYNTRDFEGRFSSEWRSIVLKEISEQFGLDPNDDKWLNDTTSRDDNQWKAWWAYSKKSDERPYLDFWHWLLDNDFCDVQNGSYQYLSKDAFDELETDGEDDWIKQILTDIFEACEGHPAYKKDTIVFYVWW
jgi:hypothetical protein